MNREVRFRSVKRESSHDPVRYSSTILEHVHDVTPEVQPAVDADSEVFDLGAHIQHLTVGIVREVGSVLTKTEDTAFLCGDLQSDSASPRHEVVRSRLQAMVFLGSLVRAVEFHVIRIGLEADLGREYLLHRIECMNPRVPNTVPCGQPDVILTSEDAGW